MSIQSDTSVDAVPSTATGGGEGEGGGDGRRRALQQRPERDAGEDVEEHEEQVAGDGADGQVRLQGAARGRRQPEAGGGDHPAEDRSATTQHHRHRQLGVQDPDASRFLGERGHDAALAPLAGEHQDRHHGQEDRQPERGNAEVARVRSDRRSSGRGPAPASSPRSTGRRARGASGRRGYRWPWPTRPGRAVRTGWVRGRRRCRVDAEGSGGE